MCVKYRLCPPHIATTPNTWVVQRPEIRGGGCLMTHIWWWNQCMDTVRQVVYSGTVLNKYGHVSIISQVTDKDIEIIQQNPGPFGDSRKRYHLIKENGKWKINNHQILGWLRKK